MAVEAHSELMAFFSPAEFGESASVTTGAGSFPLTGIPDVMSDAAKPGGVQNSSRSPFSTGAAEFTIQEFQFLTDAASVEAASTQLDDTLAILTGDYTGSYRIKDINRDGGVCRLLLNKLP